MIGSEDAVIGLHVEIIPPHWPHASSQMSRISLETSVVSRGRGAEGWGMGERRTRQTGMSGRLCLVIYSISLGRRTW